MLNSDSPISDFYPAEFPIDMDGKRQDWQGVALLPFIDYNRLVQAMATRYGELSHAEMARNVEGHNVLFVSKCNPLFRVLCNMLQNGSVPHKVCIRRFSMWNRLNFLLQSFLPATVTTFRAGCPSALKKPPAFRTQTSFLWSSNCCRLSDRISWICLRACVLPRIRFHTRNKSGMKHAPGLIMSVTRTKDLPSTALAERRVA